MEKKSCKVQIDFRLTVGIEELEAVLDSIAGANAVDLLEEEEKQ